VQLKREFDLSPDHGKSVDMHKYTVHDAVAVLLEYIATIPELLGRERSIAKRHGPRLRSEKDFAVILATLPEENLGLILVTVAFFAAYAELGRFHASLVKTPGLSYPDEIRKLAELFHTIVVRPLEPGDKSSIQTLGLVLKTPVRFRGIAMAERSKRAQSRDQIPSQPLFRRQVGATADCDAGREISGSPSWSKCATEADESEQDRGTTDQEVLSSDEIMIEDYDSEQFDAIEFDQVPSNEEEAQVEASINKSDTSGQLTHRSSTNTRADNHQSLSRLHESRLMQRRDTESLTLAIAAPTKTRAHLVSPQQKSVGLQQAPETFRPELWGLSVNDATNVAGYDVDSVFFTIYGQKIPFSGRVPIVVAKCIEKVMCTNKGAGQYEPSDHTHIRRDLCKFTYWYTKGNTATYCLRSGLDQSNPEHFAQLKESFNAPASSYGIDIDWSKYNATDAIDVLFDYLRSLREPLMPSELSCKLPSLDNYLQRNYVPSDLTSLHVYAIRLVQMPDCSRQLLLVLIAFLASQIECAERSLCDDPVGFHNEAARRWSPVLSHPLVYRTATFTLLMVNAGYFLKKANGQPPTHAEWDALIKARKELMSEADDLSEEFDQPTEAEHTVDISQESTNTATPIIPEESMQDQRQDQNSASLDVPMPRQQKEISHRDGHGPGDDFKIMHQLAVEGAVSEKNRKKQTASVDNDELIPKEAANPSERPWSWQAIEHEDTKSVDTIEVYKAAHVQDIDDDFQTLHSATAGPMPLRPPPSEPTAESASPSKVRRPRQLGLEQSQHGDCKIEEQGTKEQTRLEQHASSHSQTPRTPTENDWQQYFDGISSPPTPKSVTKLARTGVPRLNITTVDDAVLVEAPSGIRIQEERLSPMESPCEPERRDKGEAEATIRKKRSHRKSGSSWTSHPNHSRTKSLGGESTKSEKRKSKDDERRRSKDDGEAQAAQKNDQTVKKQPRRKSNGWFRKPEKGFRELVHGKKK
jgi:hypothetical protein